VELQPKLLLLLNCQMFVQVLALLSSLNREMFVLVLSRRNRQTFVLGFGPSLVPHLYIFSCGQSASPVSERG
jgi:hypothetical protein